MSKISKLVFCVDALEYNLVKKYGLKDLMQAEHGKVDVNGGLNYPLTEVIWTSFITGVPPEAHGINKVIIEKRREVYKSRIANFLNTCLVWGRKVKDIVLPNAVFKVGLKFQLRLRERCGVVPLSRDAIKTSTVLDRAEAVAIGFPLYDDYFLRKMKYYIGKYYYHEISSYEFYTNLQGEYEINQDKLNSFDLNSNSVVFIYYFILDVINHLWYDDAELVKKEYLKINNTFRDLKHKLNPEFSLVISDHGGLNGEHTDYGFYSLSTLLDLSNPGITDFRAIIEDLEGVKRVREEKKDIFEAKVEKSKKVIKEALDKYAKVAVAWTTGKDSHIILSLMREMYGEVPVPVIFSDTTVKFKETYKYRDKIAEDWELDLIVIKPEIPDGFKIAENPIECCHLLKTLPVKKKIKELGLDAVIMGIRWDEQKARAGEEYFSEREDHVRVHPLLHWSEEDVWRYLRERDIPVNLLYARGYRSLGCEPCTKPTPKDGTERSGRAQDKEEIMARLRALGYF
jgi:phosphoadenosine phosphosulfate reductase